MQTTIYVAYHQWAPRIQGDMIVPIHVGRALADAPLEGMLGDDEGDSISAQNGTWCELTALYWAWKNDRRSARIGLMHYRRVLDFADDGAGCVEARSEAFDVPAWIADTQEWLTGAGRAADVVVPRLHMMGRSVEENYKRNHNAQDWDVMAQVIAAQYPDLKGAFDRVAKGRGLRLGNMAIMARPVLDRYCTMLFDVLGRVQGADVDRTHYSAYQTRYLGFLAERLMTVFIDHALSSNPDLHIEEVGITKFDQGVVTPYLAAGDSLGAECVNIAVASDRAYLPHVAAMLRSVLDHADAGRPINIFFLHSDIAARDLTLLGGMLNAARASIGFHPINVGATFARSYRSASRAPSNATYSRFLLFSLLPGVDRLMYLDGDVIVRRDICALFDADLGDAQIGAVRDHIMTRTLSGPTPTSDPNVPDLALYHRDVLGLGPDDIAAYFNAGVVLFNFAAMDDPVSTGAALMDEAHQGRYMFRDQDILNKAFRGRVRLLDPRWNTFNSHDGLYHRVPKPLWDEARAARSDPWIIHYADRDFKPWTSRPVPRAQEYWQALIRTPFYREVIAAGQNQQGRRVSARIERLARGLAARWPRLKAPLKWLYQRLVGAR